MPSAADSNKIPPCKNPEHPANIPRDKDIVVVEETPSHVVFGCRVCRDVNKVLAIQVRTLPRGWARARYMNELRGIEKARNVVKRLGRIKYFH